MRSPPASAQEEGTAAAVTSLPASPTADGGGVAAAAASSASSSCLSSPSAALAAAVNGPGPASVAPVKRSGSSRQRVRIDVATQCQQFTPQLIAACRAVQTDDAATLRAILEGSWVEASAAGREEQTAAASLAASPAPPLKADGWIPPSVVRDNRGELLQDAHGLDIPEPSTLLHLAGRYDAVRCIRLLFDCGVQPGLLDSQRTNALSAAVQPLSLTAHDFCLSDTASAPLPLRVPAVTSARRTTLCPLPGCCTRPAAILCTATTTAPPSSTRPRASAACPCCAG